jgi:probable rRNA maturation factor
VEDLTSFWPEPEEETSGIFFTCHDVELDLTSSDRWAKWIADAIRTEGYGLERIDYIFCSDAFLLEVNQAHLGHDDYTDIITFPLNKNPILAEIYISIDRVRDNANQLNIPFDEELHRVMIHGVLHLCGYDDHEEDDIDLIRKREAYYISALR